MKDRPLKILLFLMVLVCIFSLHGCDLFSLFSDEEEDGNSSANGELDDFLGRGYDVSKEYAKPADVMSGILDTEALNADGLIEVLEVNDTTHLESHGEQVLDYCKSLASSISLSGSYFYFSGSVSTNFAYNNKVYASHSFATVQTKIHRRRVMVPDSVSTDDLKSYLTESASEAINDETIRPETLFSTFGTHVVTGLFVGARLDYSIRCDMSKVNTSKAIDVLVTAAYNSSIASIEGSTEFLSEEEQSSFNQNVSERSYVVGGNSQYGQKIMEDNSYYDQWVESIDENSIFCDYTDNGLRPIWDFADDTGRASELETALQGYLEAERVEEINDSSAIKLAEIYDGYNKDGQGYALWAIASTVVNDLSKLNSIPDYLSVVDLYSEPAQSVETPVNFANRISSVWVADGYVVSLYQLQNCQDEVFQFVGEEDQIVYHNIAKSLDIRPAGSSSGEAVVNVYHDTNLGGGRKSYYNAVQDDRLGGFMGDKISSVEILNPDYEIVLYRDSYFGGTKLTLTETALTLPSWNDQASSLEVRRKE